MPLPYYVIKTGIIVGIIIAFILIASLLQFLISIHPPRYYDKNTPEDYNINYENFSVLTSDKIRIKGWLIESDKANGTIIVGHGYPFDKGNILQVAKFLYPDYNLLFYDHRYFGESEGKITTAGYREVEDVKAVINFAQKKFNNQPIALYGFSLSASAMLMTKSNEINAIITDSPYANLDNMIDHIYFIFGPLKFPFVITTKFYAKIFLNINTKKVSPEQSIKNLTIPILLIHGEKDSQIPIENAYILKKSNPDIELWIVKNADHGYSYAMNPDEYKSKIKSFLKEHMKK